MGRAYELLYESLKPRLAGCDLEKRAAWAGLPAPIGGVIHLNFLGRPYRISQGGVEKGDDRPDNINSRSLLIHYLLSEGEAEPTGEFVAMAQLTGMPPSRNQHDNFFAKKVVSVFEDGPRKLAEAARLLNGRPEDCSRPGESHWFFQLLPKIPFKLFYYEADDEYPADIKYFFDRSSIKILEYECLAFLISCFNYELTSAVQSPQVF